MNQNENSNELKNNTQISKALLHKRCIHLSDKHWLSIIWMLCSRSRTHSKLYFNISYVINIRYCRWTLNIVQWTGTFITFLGTWYIHRRTEWQNENLLSAIIIRIRRAFLKQKVLGIHEYLVFNLYNTYNVF